MEEINNKFESPQMDVTFKFQFVVPPTKEFNELMVDISDQINELQKQRQEHKKENQNDDK